MFLLCYIMPSHQPRPVYFVTRFAWLACGTLALVVGVICEQFHPVFMPVVPATIRMNHWLMFNVEGFYCFGEHAVDQLSVRACGNGICHWHVVVEVDHRTEVDLGV